MNLLCGVSRNHTHRTQQFAFFSKPALEDVFVDSGAFPNGVYKSRLAFTELDEQRLTTRICGLFGADVASPGTVSLWIPVVRPPDPPSWVNLVLTNQLYQRKASVNLFSTNAIDTLQAQ